MTELFVCYSHKDEEVVAALEKHLGAALQGKCVSVWRDRKIAPSQGWKDFIVSKIEQSNGFIIVVSPDMLASSFILEEEIPRILKRRMLNEAELFIIFARTSVVDERDFIHPLDSKKTITLTSFQGINDPTTPLSSLKPNEIDAALADAAKLIAAKYRQRQSSSNQHLGSNDVLRFTEIHQAITSKSARRSQFDISLDWKDFLKPRTITLFPQPENLVRDLANNIKVSRITGVVGPPASGKSTLLKQVAFDFLSENTAYNGLYIDFGDAVGLTRNAFDALTEQAEKLGNSAQAYFLDNVHYVLNEASALTDQILQKSDLSRVFFTCGNNIPEYYIMLGNSVMLDALDSGNGVHHMDVADHADCIVRGVANAFKVDIEKLEAPASILTRYGGNLHSVAYSVRATVSQVLNDGARSQYSVSFAPLVDRLVSISDDFGPETILALFALSVWSRFDVALDVDYLLNSSTKSSRKLSISHEQLDVLANEGFLRTLGPLVRIQNRGLALAVYSSISEADILKARMQPLLPPRGLSNASLELEIVRSYLESNPTNMYILSKQVCNEDGVLGAIARSDQTVAAIVEMILSLSDVFDMGELLVNFEWKNHILSRKLMEALIQRKGAIVSRLNDCDKLLSVAYFLAPLWYYSKDSEIKSGKALKFRPYGSDPQRRSSLEEVECRFMTKFDNLSQFKKETIDRVSSKPTAFPAIQDRKILMGATACIKAFHQRYKGNIRCTKMIVADKHPGREIFAALDDASIIRLISTEQSPRNLHYGLSIFRYLDRERMQRILVALDPALLKDAIYAMELEERAAFTVLCVDLRVLDPSVFDEINFGIYKDLLLGWRDLIEAEIDKLN